jgi:hypothetical protein
MAIVNSELLRLARTRFNKSAAVVPGAPPADPAAMGAPPADPAAMGAAPPADPAAAAPAAPVDPMAMGAMPPMPPAQVPPSPTGPAQQKLKPEQMMQMIDYRLYNMQQQLTAIMNAMGVQLPPEAIVLPPGSTSAPAPETALPGGAGAPTAAPPQGGQQLGDVYNGMDPAQTGGAIQPVPPVKAANWWDADDPKAVSYIGDPVSRPAEDQPINLQVAADAASALYKSLMKNAR